MPYDFKTMSISALKAALDGPTGEHFARAIANELFERLVTAVGTADAAPAWVTDIILGKERA